MLVHFTDKWVGGSESLRNELLTESTVGVGDTRLSGGGKDGGKSCAGAGRKGTRNKASGTMEDRKRYK